MTIEQRQITTGFQYYDEGLYQWADSKKAEKALVAISSVIGEIVIAANSLEDALDYYIKELMSSNESSDELIYIFLSDMNYARKVNTLTKIYRWHFRFVDGSRKTRVLITRLEKLEATLKEAGETRNRYAHANWETLTKDRFVKTRTRAATDGAKHTFRQFDRSVMKRDLGLVRKAYRLLETFDEMFHCQMPF